MEGRKNTNGEVASPESGVPFGEATLSGFVLVIPKVLFTLGTAPDSQVRGPGFDTRSGNILSFLLPLFQEGQLSVTGESMCTKYWLTA